MNEVIKILFIILFYSLSVNLNSNLPLVLFLFYIANLSIILLLLYKIIVFHKKNIINNLDITILIFIILLIINAILWNNQYGIFNYEARVLLWLLYIPLYLFLKQEKRILLNYSFIILSFLGIEVILAVLQLIGILPNTDSLFDMGGTFGNPAMLSTFISAVAPLLLSIILSLRKIENKKAHMIPLLVVLFLLCIYIVLLSKIRGAWIAFVVGTTVVLYIRNSNTIKRFFGKMGFLKRGFISLVVLLLVTSIGYSLYKMKEVSANGRLLIWEISFSENRTTLLGKGIGTIEAEFGKWQADYFLKNGISEAQKNTADYVGTLYNTFLEVLIENGWIGFLLLVVILYFALSRTKRLSTIEIGCYGGVIAIITLMFSSYPFRIYPIFL